MAVDSTKLSSDTLDQLLRRQNPFVTGLDILDLGQVTFITPGGLVPLAAICHALARQQRSLTIKVDNVAVRGYLMRSGFPAVVRNLASIEPALPPVASLLSDMRRGTNPLLIELTLLESGSGLPQLLDQIVRVLRYRLKYKKYEAFDIATAVSEICQNTFDHNDQTCGFIAMQGYNGQKGRFIEIAVADFGIGLAQTLRRNPKNSHIKNDYDAIRHAAQLGTSEHDDPTRGTGLHHLLEIAYRHGGSVQIRSGAATVRYRMDKKQGWFFSAVPIPGVHISFGLRSKAKLD